MTYLGFSGPLGYGLPVNRKNFNIRGLTVDIIRGKRDPMTSRFEKNFQIAITRVWKGVERSLTPHWIGNFKENTMVWVRGVGYKFEN